MGCHPGLIKYITPNSPIKRGNHCQVIQNNLQTWIVRLICCHEYVKAQNIKLLRYSHTDLALVWPASVIYCRPDLLIVKTWIACLKKALRALSRMPVREQCNWIIGSWGLSEETVWRVLHIDIGDIVVTVWQSLHKYVLFMISEYKSI